MYIGIGDLTLHYQWGDYYDGDEGTNAFEEAIDDLCEHYPGLKYDGFIVYMASDVHGGVAGDYFMSSEKKKDNERSRAIAGEFIKDLYDAFDYYLLDFTGQEEKITEAIKKHIIDVSIKYGINVKNVWDDYFLERICDYSVFSEFKEVIIFHKGLEGWIREAVLEHFYESILLLAHKCDDEDLEEKVAYAI